MSNHEHNHSNTENIGFAFVLNLCFAFLEIIGSLFTNSLSLLSNGLHDAGDALSLGIAYILNKISKRKQNTTFTYGFKRLSLVAAFINSLILIFGSCVVLLEAIPRLLKPEHSNADGMFIFSIIGLGINLVAYLRLRNGKTLSERVSALHLLDDVLGLGSILVVSLIIKFFDYHILDPLLSILITVLVIFKVFKNFKEVISVFLQRVPYNTDLLELEEEVKKISGVVGFHDVHVWSLDGESNVLSAHVVVKDNATHEEMLEIKNQAKVIIAGKNIAHSTIEIECENENCEVIH